MQSVCSSSHLVQLIFKKVLLCVSLPTITEQISFSLDTSQQPLLRLRFDLKKNRSGVEQNCSTGNVEKTDTLDIVTSPAEVPRKKSAQPDMDTDHKSFRPRLSPSLLSVTAMIAGKSPVVLPILPNASLPVLMLGPGTPKQEPRDAVRKVFSKYSLEDETRRTLWRNKIGNRLRITPLTFLWLEQLLERQPVQPKELKVIVSDLDRTFPECDTREEGTKMYQDILHVLCLFATYRPDVGYVQGMSTLVLTLYSLFSVEETFALFSNLLLCTPFLYNLYTMHTPSITRYLSLFTAKLKTECPKLFSVLKTNGLSSDVFAYEWFFTLGARAFNSQGIRAVWDVLLSLGEFYMLFVGVAAFAVVEKEAGHIPSGCDVAAVIRRLVGQVDVQKVIKKLIESSVGTKKFGKLLSKAAKNKDDLGPSLEEPSSEDD